MNKRHSLSIFLKLYINFDDQLIIKRPSPEAKNKLEKEKIICDPE